MQPHRKLAARATQLSSALWQEVDWETRVAHLFVRLAGSMPANWGRAVYVEFVKAGVEDMPPIAGLDPADMMSEVGPRKIEMAIRKHQPNYGADFGEKAYATLKRKGLGHEAIEDIMQDFLLEIFSGKREIAGKPLGSAKSWVLRGLTNKSIDLFRREKKRDVGLPTDEEGVQRDIKDVRSWGQLSSLLTPRTVKSILNELPRVHSRAVDWFQMVLNGLRPAEIAQQWGVSKPLVSRWQRENVPKIRAIVEKYIDPEGLRMAI